MKYMFVFLWIGLTLGVQAKSNDEVIAKLKDLYPDQSLELIRQRFESLKTPQDKWRAFPPYFYDLVLRMSDSLGKNFSSRKGFCAGDAHSENFGFLYSAKPILSLNDLDDSAPCDLNTDLMRLFIGHKLIADFNGDQWIDSYQKGFDKVDVPLKGYLQKLEDESKKGGTSLPKKFKKMLADKSCQGEYAQLTSLEFLNLKNAMATEGLELVFGCSRTKITGGSAGYKRLIGLTETVGVEYKPLNRPAPILKDVSTALRIDYFKTAVTSFMGASYHSYYVPVMIDGKLYQRRPLWSGNVGIELSDIPENELLGVFYEQARILGTLHRNSSTTKLEIVMTDWSTLADKILDKWKSEFLSR